MKKLSLIFTAICLTASLFSQETEAKRSSLTIFSGLERTLYWDLWAHHFGLEYGYNMDNRLSLNVGFGQTLSSTSEVTPYDVEQSIKISQPHVNVLYALLGNDRRNSLRVGMGFKLLYVRLENTYSFKVENSMPVDISYFVSTTTTTGFNLLLQNDFRIAKNLFVGLQLDFNPVLGKDKLPLLQILYNEDIGGALVTTTLNSEPQPLLHGLIRLGLKF